MPLVWLCPQYGGSWSHSLSVGRCRQTLERQWREAICHASFSFGQQGHHAQRLVFPLMSPGEDDPAPPERQHTSPPVSSPSTVQAELSTFFTSSSELPTCGCCKAKLLGDIVLCRGYNQRVHAVCKEGAKCFRCVSRVCDFPPRDIMPPYKSCMHRVHDASAIAGPHRIERVCETCIPKPQEPAPTATKKGWTHCTPKWQIGRPLGLSCIQCVVAVLFMLLCIRVLKMGDCLVVPEFASYCNNDKTHVSAYVC